MVIYGHIYVFGMSQDVKYMERYHYSIEGYYDYIRGYSYHIHIHINILRYCAKLPGFKFEINCRELQQGRRNVHDTVHCELQYVSFWDFLH